MIRSSLESDPSGQAAARTDSVYAMTRCSSRRRPRRESSVEARVEMRLFAESRERAPRRRPRGRGAGRGVSAHGVSRHAPTLRHAECRGTALPPKGLLPSSSPLLGLLISCSCSVRVDIRRIQPHLARASHRPDSGGAQSTASCSTRIPRSIHAHQDEMEVGATPRRILWSGLPGEICTRSRLRNRVSSGGRHVRHRHPMDPETRAQSHLDSVPRRFGDAISPGASMGEWLARDGNV